MSQYVLGVDGGGSKTHYAIFDMHGNLINFIEGGSSYYEMYSNGYEGVSKEIWDSFARLLQPKGLKPEDIGYGIFGLSGVDTRSETREYSRIIQNTGIKNFKVFNDAFLGIKAGSLKGYGICSINGSGTCCTGIDRNGRWEQIGGRGFRFGDEAGSRHIGSMVIRKVYDSYFRCAPQTIMETMLFEKLAINSENDLVDTVYEKVYTGDIKITDFCKIAFAAANLNDEAALDILKKAGKEMAASVVGAIRTLDFSLDEEIDVIMAGSVSIKGENPALVDEFKSKVSSNAGKKINFILLQGLPVTGAVIWAMEELGGKIHTEIREKIARELVSYC
jgi:N-acetylglucosamine kinase-like BadF-type ATPase